MYAFSTIVSFIFILSGPFDFRSISEAVRNSLGTHLHFSLHRHSIVFLAFIIYYVALHLRLTITKQTKRKKFKKNVAIVSSGWSNKSRLLSIAIQTTDANQVWKRVEKIKKWNSIRNEYKTHFSSGRKSNDKHEN